MRCSAVRKTLEWLAIESATMGISLLGIVTILTAVQISTVEADGRRVNSQKFDKVFTNQTLEHYSSHVVRSVAECTSICISDKLVECKAFSLRESLSSGKDCLLYNTTVDIPASNGESSAHSFSVYATIDRCIAGEHDCHLQATCSNTVGSYTCFCNIGYSGDGKMCTAYVCDSGYSLNPYSLRCFQPFCCERTWTWSEAKDHCESLGEYLLTFPTAESANWFYNFKRSSNIGMEQYFWVGVKWSSGEWRWEGLTSGTISTSDSKWSYGNPGNSEDGYCGFEFYTSSRGINTVGCSAGAFVICEKAATT